MTTLKRQLGLKSATALIIGEVIAVGVFLTPAGMTKSLGSPFWLLVIWLAMALDETTRGIVNYLRWRTGRWRTFSALAPAAAPVAH